MNHFFYIILTAFIFTGCKQMDINNEIPLTTLGDISPGFGFSIKSSPVGKGILPSKGEYLVVINDEATYLDEIITPLKLPIIDFTTHTLLALELEVRGSVTLKPKVNEGKTILTVTMKIPKLGPQGAGFRRYSAIVPKVDSSNVILELNYINEK